MGSYCTIAVAPKGGGRHKYTAALTGITATQRTKWRIATSLSYDPTPGSSQLTVDDFPSVFRNFRVKSDHASHLASQLVTQKAYILCNAPLFLARLWRCAHLSLVSNLVSNTDSTQTTHEVRHTVSMGIASRCSRDTASLGIGKFDRPGTGSNSTPTMVERCYKPLPSVLYSHAPLSTSGTNFS